MRSDQACSCGHARNAHAHNRPGSDCGSCGPARCVAFSSVRASGWLSLPFRGRKPLTESAVVAVQATSVPVLRLVEPPADQPAPALRTRHLQLVS